MSFKVPAKTCSGFFQRGWPAASDTATIRLSVTRGPKPRPRRAQTSRSAQNPILSSSDQRNTVDLLQGGLPALHQPERGLAQEYGTRCRGIVLERAGRRPRDDQLTHLIGHQQHLRYRLAALVSRSATVAATLADAELKLSGLRIAKSRSGQERRLGLERRHASRADQPHEALRDDAVHRGNEAVGV